MAGQHSLKIEIEMGSSCALYDMSGICNFTNRPADAMWSFWNAAQWQLPSLVVFHGVVENRGTDKGWCKDGCEYVQQFTAFIREHKLGNVVEGASAENKHNHPGHIIQVNSWAPDYTAIHAWAESNPLQKAAAAVKKLVIGE